MDSDHSPDTVSNHKFRLVFILTISLQLIMMVYYGTLKTGFHVDEIWTFAHSNSLFKPYLYQSLNSDWKVENTDNSFFNQWIAGDEYYDYITLTDSERFRYDSVVYNV